jgi:hypothetical protein
MARAWTWDEAAKTLSAVSLVVRHDPYTVTLHVPAGMRPFTEGNRTTIPHLEHVADRVWRFTVLPEQSGELGWAVAFQTIL